MSGSRLAPGSGLGESIARRLERFAVRPEVEFLGPGGALLGVQMPVGVGDRVDPEQAVLTALGGKLRGAVQQALTGDAAVDHDVCDMQARRTELARHALRHRA